MAVADHECEYREKGVLCMVAAAGAITDDPLHRTGIWLCERHLKRELRKGWPRWVIGEEDEADPADVLYEAGVQRAKQRAQRVRDMRKEA